MHAASRHGTPSLTSLPKDNLLQKMHSCLKVGAKSTRQECTRFSNKEPSLGPISKSSLFFGPLFIKI